MRNERKLLCLAAQNPPLALAYSATLASTSWHGRNNALLAESLLDSLEANPNASAAQLVTNATQLVPAAGNLLTVDVLDADATAEGTMAFLAEELSIGDMADTIAALKAQLGTAQPEEEEMLFASISALQHDLSAREVAHARNAHYHS